MQAMTRYVGQEARATLRRRTLLYLPEDGRDQGGMKAR